MYVRLYFEVTSTCILHCISHASISKLHAGVFYTVFCLTSSAKRNRSCTITMVEEAKWKSVTEGVGQLLSMKEGVAIIKAFDQGADGKWKWAKQPGNARTRSVFTCNNHATCAANAGKLMRCVQQGGVFILQEKGDHGSLLSPFKRSNSVLTWDEEKSMKFAMSTGGKPGALHTVFTTDAAQVLEDAGEDPLLHKRPEGGLAGELCQPRAPGCTRAKGLHLSIVFQCVLCMYCVVYS